MRRPWPEFLRAGVPFGALVGYNRFPEQYFAVTIGSKVLLPLYQRPWFPRHILPTQGVHRQKVQHHKDCRLSVVRQGLGDIPCGTFDYRERRERERRGIRLSPQGPFRG